MLDNGKLWNVGDRVTLEGTVLSERSGFVRVRWENGSVSHEWAPDLQPADELERLRKDYADLADGIEAREAELERLKAAVANSPQPATAPGQATDQE